MEEDKKKKVFNFQEIILESSLYSSKFDFEDIGYENVKEYVDSEDYMYFQRRKSAAIMSRGSGEKIETNFWNFFFQPKGTKLDCYCKECNKVTSFKFIFEDKTNEKIIEEEFYFNLSYFCTRCEKEKLYFSFKKYNNALIKVGEYPSKYDQYKKDTKEYEKILGTNFDEYNKAIIVDSLGFSVAGFTYLRRILENVIIDFFEENKTDFDIGKKEFQKMSMEKQLKIIKKILPEFIRDNSKMIYSILSKHIHELTDESAKSFFPLMLESIKSILEKRLQALEKKKRDESLKQQISVANKVLGKN